MTPLEHPAAVTEALRNWLLEPNQDSEEPRPDAPPDGVS